MHISHDGLFASVTGFIARRRRIRAAARTERILGALPHNIRKDIGWPDAYAGRRARHG